MRFVIYPTRIEYWKNGGRVVYYRATSHNLSVVRSIADHYGLVCQRYASVNRIEYTMYFAQ